MFTLPVEDADERWERLMDTSDAEVPPDRFEGGTAYPTVGRSVALFRLVRVVPRIGDRKSDVEMTKATPIEPALAQAPWAQAEAAQPTPKRRGTHGAQGAGPRRWSPSRIRNRLRPVTHRANRRSAKARSPPDVTVPAAEALFPVAGIALALLP